MKIFTFFGLDCEVIKKTYGANGQLALVVVAADTENNRDKEIYPGDPVTTASVCIPEIKFSSNETVIKNYSENEGLLPVLVKSNIVALTQKSIRSGYVEVPVVAVLV